MAVTKIKPITGTVNKALAYILNPGKTDEKLLVSSFGCVADESAAKEFEWTRNLAEQHGAQPKKVIARHLIQSFPIGEVTPEQAHEIGKQLADELLKGQYAFNSDGYCVTLFYDGTSKELNINLDVPIGDEAENSAQPTEESQEKPEATVPASATDYKIDYADAKSFEQALNDGVKVNGKIVQFDVVEYKPDSVLGINCWSGEHLNFISEEELDVGKGNIIVGRITDEPSKTLGSWKIPYEVLSIGGEKIESDTTEPSNPEESSDAQPSKIALPMGSDDFKGMDYKEAERIFREMGFTTFEYSTIETETDSISGTICYIEITEWFIGDSDFVEGDEFDADSTITFYSYEYVAPSPVSYSTNDLETAKKGNSGVFSYKGSGGSYTKCR